MPLKAVISKLEDVDEAVRTLYAAGEGDFKGRFVLQVEASDGLQLAPVQKLQSALQAARQERDEAMGQLKGFKDADGNPIDVAKLMRNAEELDKLKKLGGKDEEKLKALEESLKQSYSQREAQLAEKHKKEVAEREGKIGSYKAQLHEALLVKAATDAIVKHGGFPEVLLPHIERLCKAEDVVVGGKEAVKYSVIDPATGQKRISAKAGSADDMTVEELVEELRSKEAFAGCFKPSGNGGTGSNGGGGRRQPANRQQQHGSGNDDEPSDPVERLRAFREQQAASGAA